MLGSKDAFATIAVKDVKTARQFYADQLGLEEAGTEGTEFVYYRTGRSQIFVYKSRYAGTNEATAATWLVGDVESVVRELKARGVAFEHYDLPGATRRGDLHVAGDMTVAWFKDPDGNIHSVASG